MKLCLFPLSTKKIFLSYCWRASRAMPRVNFSKESRDLLNNIRWVGWKTYRNTFLLVLSWWPINKTFYVYSSNIKTWNASFNILQMKLNSFFCVAWFSSLETKHCEKWFLKNSFTSRKSKTDPACQRLGLCFMNKYFTCTFISDAFQREWMDECEAWKSRCRPKLHAVEKKLVQKCRLDE